jgi:hypothetical protein
MRNLPFSQQWRDETYFRNQSVNFYIECPESWARAKREVQRGNLVLLFPENVYSEDYQYPVHGKEVLVFDLDRSQEKLARLLGVKLIQVGASMVIYLGETTIFFKPVESA